VNNYYNPVDQVERNIEEIKNWQKMSSLTQENVFKIKNSAGTKEIRHPEYKNSYEYVDNLFPLVGIKNVIIYQVSPSYLTKLGYYGVGGFFEKINKSVVISSKDSFFSSSSIESIKAKISKDEVIVHELIHYCYDKEGYLTSNSHLKEEFAYGWSWGYLHNKGYSNEEIIKYNYLPYLYSVCWNDALFKILSIEGVSQRDFSFLSNTKRKKILGRCHKKIHEKCMELSYAMGRKIIEIYSEKILSYGEPIKKITEKSRNYFLDLEE
jgi:hypothetical protein